MDKDKELEVLFDKINITKTNYINMVKRFNNNDSFIKYVLTYYSLFLILSGITAKFFTKYNSYFDSYINIIFSITLLILSLLNQNLRYSERIDIMKDVTKELNSLEGMLDYETIKVKYCEIIENAEIRADIDYFKTACEFEPKTDYYKKQLEIEKENKKMKYITRFKHIIMILIIIAPILIFISNFFI